MVYAANAVMQMQLSKNTADSCHRFGVYRQTRGQRVVQNIQIKFVDVYMYIKLQWIFSSFKISVCVFFLCVFLFFFLLLLFFCCCCFVF